jgi:2-aminoethylphosphonate-pyruvate transaminase
MNMDHFPDNPYLLLTPGPLSTSKSVKGAMLRDWCTWDDDYNRIVQHIRTELVSLATVDPGYTAVLMQGSGTFGVESVITTAVPRDGKLLVIANGAYGLRMAAIAGRAAIPVSVYECEETEAPDVDHLMDLLKQDPGITHVSVVHCETTTGMLNPISDIGAMVKCFDKVYIVDAMSSFGGIRMDMGEFRADYLISSANKCIQGVPGFSFVVARQVELEKTRDRARSLSLDLFDQWETMETHPGKWRFTSPTHVVRAFTQALEELKTEGGIDARSRRYHRNNRLLVGGMRKLGFCPLLPRHFTARRIRDMNSSDSMNCSRKKALSSIRGRSRIWIRSASETSAISIPRTWPACWRRWPHPCTGKHPTEASMSDLYS